MPNENVSIRAATPDDAARFAEIYRPYVETTSITFEYAAPDEAEFRRRISSTLENYPYLAAVSGENVIGYAYAGRYHARAAYDWCAELSIYIDQDERGHGVGKRLYGALTELCEAQNIQNLYAIVTHPNDPSLSFHESFGFSLDCVQRSCGFKLGKWRDVMYLEKSVGGHPVPPPEFISFPGLAAETVAEILKNHSNI